MCDFKFEFKFHKPFFCNVLLKLLFKSASIICKDCAICDFKFKFKFNKLFVQCVNQAVSYARIVQCASSMT